MLSKTYCSSPVRSGVDDTAGPKGCPRTMGPPRLQDYSPKSFLSWTCSFWMSILGQFVTFWFRLFCQIFASFTNTVYQIAGFWLAIVCQMMVFPFSLIHHLHIWWLVFVVRATSFICLLGLGLGLGSILIYRLYSRLFASGNAAQPPPLTARGRRRSSQSSLDEISESRRLSPQSDAELDRVSDTVTSDCGGEEVTSDCGGDDEGSGSDMTVQGHVANSTESLACSNAAFRSNNNQLRHCSPRTVRLETVRGGEKPPGYLTGVAGEQSDIDALHSFLREHQLCPSLDDSGVGDSSNRSSTLFCDADESVHPMDVFDEFMPEKREELIDAEWNVSYALRKLLSSNPPHWMDLKLNRGKAHKHHWACSELKQDWGQIVLKKVLFADAKCQTSTPHWVLEELLDL